MLMESKGRSVTVKPSGETEIVPYVPLKHIRLVTEWAENHINNINLASSATSQTIMCDRSDVSHFFSVCPLYDRVFLVRVLLLEEILSNPYLFSHVDFAFLH